jgi:GNAT superfamily N-acetyltransferase
MSGDSEIVIRASQPEDRPRARAVLGAVGWVDAPGQHRYWPEADADWQARHYLREIVAEVDGVIAARVALEAYRQPFAELCGLSVRPDYRRQGLGQKLTKVCEQEAARRGFAFLFLQTGLDNHAGHSLYANLGYIPTTRGAMLRMLRFLDYPLLTDFQRAHPLSQYRCEPVKDAERAFHLTWSNYITEDTLRLRLEGGSSEFDSGGIGPALTALDWRVEQGGRGLSLHLQPEPAHDIEPGHHVALEMIVRNQGRRMESGLFQMILPPGLRVSSPATNEIKTFAWEVAPGEEVTQPIVVQVEPAFDATPLWYLNYNSLPISVETFWEGQRALLSASLPMAVPPPRE